MKWDYTPPRRFSNPFVKTEDREKKDRKTTPKDFAVAQAGSDTVGETA
jgi:hypothetical protein